MAGNALTTRLARRYWIRKAVLLALSLTFAGISGYLGFFRFPAEYEAFQDYHEMRQLEFVAAARRLDNYEAHRLDELKARLVNRKLPPIRREQSSVVFQVLVFFVFLVLSAGLSVTWVASRHKRFILHSDFRMDTPWGSFERRDLVGINSIHWGRRRLAALEVNTPRRSPGSSPSHTTLKLDGWKYDQLDAIIDRLTLELSPPENAEDRRDAMGPNASGGSDS